MEIIPSTYLSKDELRSNSYLAIDSKKDCVLFDPSCDYDGIINYIAKNNLNLKAILITHGHYDHFYGLKRYINKFNMPIYIGYKDANLLNDSSLNCSVYSNERIEIDCDCIKVVENEQINLLEEPIEVIDTPYHTEGSVCYLFRKNKLLISGDSLFKMFLGRDDLPTSKPRLRASSLAKLALLDDDTKVYPGHGPTTTIKSERRNFR